MHTWKVYILAITSFLVGTSEYIISGILDRVAHSLGISLAAAGQLLTVFSLAYAIGTPILMAMTASIDRRKVMIYSLALFVSGNILSFVLPGYGWFVVARIIMALGAGMVVVCALNITAKISPPGKQASSIATVIMGITASLIIGVPIGRMIAEWFDWRFVFVGIALLGIIAMMIIFFAIPSTKGDEPIPLREQLALLKDRKVALGLSITFFLLSGYAIAYTYLSPYLLKVSEFNSHWLSLALLIFGIASLIGSKFGGYSADRWGIPVTLIGGMTLHVLMLIILSFVTNSIVGILTVLILWSFSAWSSGPTQQFHLATLKPKSSGVLLGLNQSMMQLALAAGAGVGGIAVDRISLASVTWFGAGGVAVAILTSLLLFNLKEVKKTKKAVHA